MYPMHPVDHQHRAEARWHYSPRLQSFGDSLPVCKGLHEDISCIYMLHPQFPVSAMGHIILLLESDVCREDSAQGILCHISCLHAAFEMQKICLKQQVMLVTLSTSSKGKSDLHNDCNQAICIPF